MRLITTEKDAAEVAHEALIREWPTLREWLSMIRHVEAGDGLVKIALALTSLACPLKDRIVADAKRAILALDGVRQVDVELVEMSAAEERQRLSDG